ncbi:Exodeoxyribonuclease 7 large subunit [Vibrio nigripulchritudo SFn27]|uniref:Exodeoxyribonuclease 7 large subunit n=1 Tax=Vibrio nigripulchritudo TaxID=28173 RepID=U4K0Q6_9VIBR|nr:exodeoxyribonuclease VII large subunit [Vibrio nigripulchritudo]CCN82271.1 Exodeoxyribonuclease 7 large subunit [Vibrio nigripulchritudo BLFn1]CCN88513.1 Exodeoxyribonuclease 7 large subunit [Vibrio nigripulchritudo SFn27]CCN95920.1 Exodeoxyribonuclease 7 large subunit [Vibrio nigripulchritudo ENn2]CCO39191.1 Exodeoxyribonuclease 7 large subunit [Vibrio nigripulchritudo SFn135]CCO50843.1 Exodeoxyribonuclease 7 large subunit [Vibrio nigripulchritudo Wn13]
MSSLTNNNIFTVSRLNSEVRLLLENEMGIVWLVGEISNFSAPVSGHWYFTLKDARAQVKCAMFRGNNRRVTFKPQNGNQVLVKARLSLYEPRGDYQLIIESMQPEGDGRLQQEFEELKMKLAAEGLFAQSSKQPLPDNPKQVGVITSKTGAALHDILDVLKRRDPSLPIVVYPTIVQGEQAAISIAQAIGRANERNECDVLIVGRGGGSLEDLWCFNNEILARTIAASQIPIVSAVGHEVDVTIADFVADVRAPTPSAAAELVSRDNNHKVLSLRQKQQSLHQSFHRFLSEQKMALSQLERKLERQHPSFQLQQQSQRLDELEQRLHSAVMKKLSSHQLKITSLEHRLALNSPEQKLSHLGNRLSNSKTKLFDAMDRQLLLSRHQLSLAAEKLDTVSPLATLKRGYSITQLENGKVVTTDKSVEAGDVLVTRLAEGEIRSIVSE